MYESFNIRSENNDYQAQIAEVEVGKGAPQDNIVFHRNCNMNNNGRFITVDRDSSGSKRCSENAFGGEGYAGWQGTDPSSCLGAYWLFPNARVPQRLIYETGSDLLTIETFDASIMMFHHKEEQDGD